MVADGLAIERAMASAVMVGVDLVIQEYSDFSTRKVDSWGRDKMADIFQTTFFKCIFLNENIWISNTISLKFVPKGPIDNNTALVQILASMTA